MNGIQYPRLGYYGAMAGNGVPLLNTDGSLNLTNLSKQAMWDVPILDVYPVVHRPDILDALRTLNPFAECIMYVVMRWWQNPNPALGPRHEDFAWRFFEITNRETNGALYQTDGATYPAGDNWVNLSNHETCTALADLIVAHAGRWDGVLLDDFCPGFGGNPGIDYVRAGHQTWEGFRAAWEMGHRLLSVRVKNGIGAKPLVFNYGVDVHPDIMSGGMREGFPFQNVGEPPLMDGWQGNMLLNPWGKRGYLKEQYAEPHLSVLVSDPRAGMAMSAQRLRFGLGSATLDDGIHSFKRGENDAVWVRNHLDWWFPEYTFGKGQKGSGKGWLGRALGEAYKLSTGVWTRDFERGAVFVNPTLTVQNASTPLMRKHDGPAKRAWVIPSQDAILLQRQ